MEQKKQQNQKGQPGSMTVEEAGRMGGEKGGQQERELIEKGHQVEQKRGGIGGEEPQGGSQKRKA